MPSIGKKERIGKFTSNSKDLYNLILKHRRKIEVYSGPSYQKDDLSKHGMLIFSYNKQPEDKVKTFLFFADGLTPPEEIDGVTGKLIDA